MAATAATPDPAGLVQALATVFSDPKMVETMQARYVEPALTASPQEFAAFLRKDREAAAAIVRIARETKAR